MSVIKNTALIVAGTAIGVGAAVVAYRNRDRIAGAVLAGLITMTDAFEMPIEDDDDLEPYERDIANQPVTSPTNGGEALFRNAS